MWLQLSEPEEALTPVFNWRNDPDRAGNAVKVCTWDRAGLFSKIAGSFSATQFFLYLSAGGKYTQLAGFPLG